MQKRQLVEAVTAAWCEAERKASHGGMKSDFQELWCEVNTEVHLRPFGLDGMIRPFGLDGMIPYVPDRSRMTF